ncbi:dTDP-glucose 4,6-dehydratase [mine drainage metagenome]|uniref:dTDP-glucose 4,6-dehydratase n=1 Tax=mine drainage metagenome TaxID=410659 RepID=T1CJ84_9ZZZZ
MTTLLVTGGAGFIGGNFVLAALRQPGMRVINLDKLTYAGNLDTLAVLRDNPQHVFVHGDIGDRALVARLLAEHAVDAVLNFAAESHVDRSIDGPAEFVQTNVVGTLALLEARATTGRRCRWRVRTGFAFCTYPPTRCTARWVRSAPSPRPRRMRPTRPIRRPRRHPIIWCALSTTPTACPR